jgi:dinuclear metal center YbgI/SA1388 family protein
MDNDLKKISHYLQDLLQIDRFQDMAINGLQVEGKGKIKSIATAVTASLAVIKQAAKLKVDALFVHHGLFLKGKEQVIKGKFKEKLKLLLDNDISLFGYHLPLDAHEKIGNNWAAAHELGFKNIEPFGFFQGMPIGVKGSFKPCLRSDFQKKLERLYGQPAHAALGGKEKVSSCAIVSGGAHKLIHDAVAEGVDCYVTGSFDEPIWHIAFEEKINFFALGHAATEKIGIKLLGEKLRKEFGVTTTFIDEPNPF